MPRSIPNVGDACRRVVTRHVARAFAVASCVAAGCAADPPMLSPEFGEKLRRLDAIRPEEFALGGAAAPAVEASEDPHEILRRARLLVARPAPPEAVRITLLRVRASALANDPDLQVSLVDPGIADASADVEAAKFAAVVALDATRDDERPGGTAGGDFRSLGPSIRVPLRTGGVATLRESFDSQDGNGLSGPDRDRRKSLGFSIVQPLLRGGGVATARASIVVARLEARQAEARTKLAAIRALARAEKAYWDLYFAHRALEVQLDEYERSLQQVDLARRLVAEGVFAAVEVKRALSGAARTVDAILLAETDRRIAQRELKRLMNEEGLSVVSATTLVPADEPQAAPLVFDRERLVALAVANRMEILDGEVQLVIDGLLIDVRRNETLPRLDVGFSYSHGGDSVVDRVLRDQIGRDIDRRSVTLSFEFPLGNEAAQARLRRALLQRTRDESVRMRLVQAVGQEVCDVADAFEQDWRRVLAARRATLLAADTYEAEVAQFQAGAVTSTDVLAAASQVATAQSAEIVALRDYAKARVDLAFATGTVLGESGVRWSPAAAPGK